MSQKASASSSVPGTSAATRSTTSRQNSCGMCASNSAWVMPYSAREGMAPLDAGPGKPEPMKVALGQRHGRVEADDRKQPRDVQDGLDDLLAHRGVQVVELRGVVPGKAGAVVAVIDVARLAGAVVAAAEDDGGVGLLVVVVFDLDLDTRESCERSGPLKL